MADQRNIGVSELSSILEPLVWSARILRWLKLKGVVRAVRGRASWSLFHHLHSDAIHRMRDLGIRMERWDENEIETTRLAAQVASGCAALMRDILELEQEHFHCCLKVLRPEGASDSSGNGMFVATWARSENSSGRDDIEDAHLVGRNSVWAALLGRSDGIYDWRTPRLCFSCGDLEAQGTDYQNSRENWRQFYNSTLVFPLRYAQYTGEGREIANIGFLAFDSTATNGFGKMPNIFEYRGRSGSLQEYHNQLSQKTVFQIGAILADCLSMFLRPAYEQLKKETHE